MAPPKSKKPQNHPEGEQCDVCGIVIARRGDMPRHKRTHAAAEDKNAMLHRCSWEGCNYSSLQRPNVDTHYRTHTKERNQACPDCDSKFSDPGSLIRHRKNLHGYVPKPRKTRQRGGTTAAPEQPSSTRGGRRHQPYSRSPSASSPSDSSSPEPTSATTTATETAAEVTATTNTPTTNAFPVILPPDYDYTAMQSIFLSKPRHEAGLTPDFDPNYFWRYQDAERITRTPSPKLLFPATGAGKEFQQPVVHYLGYEITPQHISWVGSGCGMEQPIPAEPLVGEEVIELNRVSGEEKEQRWESLACQHDFVNHGMCVKDASTFTTTTTTTTHTPSSAFDSSPFAYDMTSQLVQPLISPSSTSSSPYNLALDYSQPVGCGLETLETSMFFVPSEAAYTYPSEVLKGLSSSGLELELGVINYDRI